MNLISIYVVLITVNHVNYIRACMQQQQQQQQRLSEEQRVGEAGTENDDEGSGGGEKHVRKSPTSIPVMYVCSVSRN